MRLVNPPSTGTVVFALFDSANTFGDLRDPALLAVRPLDGRDVYRIDNVPPGEYALLVYHDENGNGRIDRNIIGIPRESLGFSNRYRPKGPPNYRRASFVLDEDDSRRFEMELLRPIGKRGRLGAGLGVLARSSPYRDYQGGVYQLIPAVTYSGERLQIFGPRVQFGLWGDGHHRLAATGQYRMGVYEEDESDYLDGMGDPKATFMAGLALRSQLPGGLDVTTSYAHDALDRIGGGEARLVLGKSFQLGSLRVSPQLGINWLGSELAGNDFGVPAERATPTRPAYTPADAVSVEGGVGLFVELTDDWLVIANMSVERLGRDATDSPIVSEDYVLKGFGALTHVF